MLEFLHHFEKFNQTKFLETSFWSLKKATFLWQLRRKYPSSKVFENLRFVFQKKYEVQTLNFLLVKNIAKDFLDLKILTTKDDKLKADKNSTKVPISNVNFSNKILISEGFNENVILLECLKILCPLTVKWRLFQFLAKFVFLSFLSFYQFKQQSSIPHTK